MPSSNEHRHSYLAGRVTNNRPEESMEVAPSPWPLRARANQQVQSTMLQEEESGRNLLLDLIATDDRPTFVLEQQPSATDALNTPFTPHVVFRNAALETFIATLADGSPSFDSWLYTASMAAADANPNVLHVGVFGGRHWSSKRLVRCGWTIIHCRKHDWTHPASRLKDKSPVNAALPVKDDHASQADPPLDSLPVDWIIDPQLATDPWAAYLMNYDWDKTAIGAIETWPFELRSRAITIMSNPEPRCVFWDDDLKMIYNEACVLRLGQQHPASLGNPIALNWGHLVFQHHMQSIRHSIAQGKASIIPNVELLSEARGFLEESYHNFTFTPIPADNGLCAGFLFEYTDTTPTVFQSNRNNVVAAITTRAADTGTLGGLWSAFVDSLEAESQDVSYAMLFTVDRPLMTGPDLLSKSVDVSRWVFHKGFGLDTTPFQPTPPPSLTAALAGENINLLQSKFGTLPTELAVSVPRGRVSHAYIVPVTSSIGEHLAYVILGMNPRRPVDESYSFVRNLRDVLMRSAVMIRLPEERRRTEQANMALLDQLRLAKVKVEKNKETFERMSRNAPVGMFIHGPEGEPVYANDFYLKLLNQTQEQFLNTTRMQYTWPDTFYEEDYEKVQRLLASMYGGTPSATFSYQIKSPIDAIPRWVEGIAFAEHDASGKVVSVQGWILDVSHRKFGESVKDERLQEAIDNKQATERFLDMISHEIRNPLSSILLLVDEILDLLPSSSASPASLSLSETLAVVDAAHTVKLCANHQKNIVDDVLELSKLDSDLLVLVLEKAQPVGIIEASLKMLTADFTVAKIESSIQVLPSYQNLANKGVLIDSSRITQVIINLCSNAIKFTKESADRKITVTLGASRERPTWDDIPIEFIPRRANPSVRGGNDVQGMTPLSAALTDADNDIYLHFSITDTGRGLTTKELEQLFQRFSQASPKTYKQYGGSGLGLFISRQMIELHGGQIGVQSTPSKGSTFAFYIRARRAESSSLQAKSTTQLKDVYTAALPSRTKLSIRRNNDCVTVSVKNLHVLCELPF